MRIRGKSVSILLLSAVLAATAPRDGATILNSGSTNTAGYKITLWSDGTATAQVGRGAPAPFTISKEAAERFFADVKAARGNGAQLQHCMKSASFGTRTIVQWHGWSSPDLQCPPFTAEVSALAKDVSEVQTAANIHPGNPLMRRIPMPVEMRMQPSASPSPAST